MDINILRQIGVVLGTVAFLAVCWWAFSPKRKKRFEEDAKLPFADEEQSARSAEMAGKRDPSKEQKEFSEQKGSSSKEQNKGHEEK